MLHREAVLIGCMLLKMSHSYSVLDSAIRVNSKSRFLCFNFVHDFITGHYESLLPVNQIVSDSLKVIDGLIRWLQWSTKSIQFNICRARFSIWFESSIFLIQYHFGDVIVELKIINWSVLFIDQVLSCFLSMLCHIVAFIILLYSDPGISAWYQYHHCDTNGFYQSAVKTINSIVHL